MPISVVFDPPLPSDSPSTFNTKAFTLLGDLNDWSTQANALPGEVATNLTTLLAAPPSIGSTTPAAGSFTTLSASGAVTITGSLSTGGVSITGGSFAAGRIYKTSFIGLSMVANTGSVLDFALYEPTGTYELIKVPTGTRDVQIPGTLSLTGGTFRYGTGAGGTVTQATSKSTAVTLNKPCGTITTHNAALASGASEVFMVSNSYAAFNDLVLLSVTSVTPNWGDYEVSHQSTGSGAFFIKIKNASASSRSDAVEIVFALITGVAS